ncbi:MAG: ABC transporter ATP-binding protein [Eubacteriales bacterium]
MFKIFYMLCDTAFPFIQAYIFKEIINEITSGLKNQRFFQMLTAYVFYIFISLILPKINIYFGQKYDLKIERYMDSLFVDKFANLDIAFFDSSGFNDNSDFSISAMYSVKKLENSLFSVITSVLKLIISSVLLITVNPLLFICLIVFTFAGHFYNYKSYKTEWLSNHNMTNISRKMKYLKDIYTNNYMETILFNPMKYFIKKYEELWQINFKTTDKISRKKMAIAIISNLLSLISQFVFLIYYVFQIIAKRFTIGDAQYYLTLTGQLDLNLYIVINYIGGFENNQKNIKFLRSFLDSDEFVTKTGTKIPSKMPEIEFSNVSFKYNGKDQYILKNCSFKIKKGEKIGLVGLNGSGKTTIVKLLLRLYDPDEGTIYVDGIDAKNYDLKKLRSIFGVMFQDVIGYAFTLKENIILSNEAGSDDIERFNKICMISKVDEIISKLKNGPDTYLTRMFDDDAKQLSIGQWQRICLARALFRDSDFVILDEPSASVDPETEHEIFGYFAKVSQGKSSVLISHRLSNMRMTDRILVLNNGVIIEEGTHEQLMEKHGEYYDLFNIQAKKYDPTVILV